MRMIEKPVAVLGCLSVLPLAALFVACNPTIALLVLAAGVLVLCLKFILTTYTHDGDDDEDADEGV